MKRISQARLEYFLSGKYGWKNLPPDDVKAMALELAMYRRLEKPLLELAKNIEAKHENHG